MTTQKKVRVLVVDDSAFMRVALEKMLQEHPDIEVVGSASNGREAVEKVSRLRPDAVTMDIEMPVMDGLHALKEIMRTSPLPVIMVSSLTQNGAQATLDALDLGAVDYLGKPGSAPSVNIFHLKNELQAKVLATREARPAIPKFRVTYVPQKRSSGSEEPNTRLDRIVVIGASTGGPPAVQNILASLPGKLGVPIVVAQHMPKTFTNAFAQRLNSLCPLLVKEAVDEEILQRSVVYICPGDSQTRIKNIGDERFMFSIVSNEIEKKAYAPCIDLLFDSAADQFGRRTLGVILTGMGDDGVKGLSNIRGRGGFTIAQDKMTSVVFGMPKAAAERGAACRILPLGQISAEIELSLRG